ncbi:phytoene desaturase [Deminuibacter soli]|uniref:Phytoene desaturase n=2 Tax=Deminuibacter soli TaxID=2291815 RepID=A0A3E1NFU1_9BACT|nr:phytoene desaturase [Deminuibacter soli]
MQQNAIVIGAGVAGMACAIRLAVAGYAVTVFEKNAAPGGKLSQLQLGNYSFDTGPSLFTEPGNIAALFALAGEPMQDYFSYEPLAIACRYFYEDGTVLDGFTNAQLLAEEIAQKTGEPATAVTQYLHTAAGLYNSTGKIFLQHSLHSRKTWLHAPIREALRHARPAYLLKSLHRLNSQCFNDARVVQLFNRFATYNGSNPYKAPAMLRMIPHLEHNEGVFYPKGGMISIANALYRLACVKGVVFHFNTPVQHILQQQNRVQGVTAGNRHYYAPVVISNIDAYFTYKYLLGNEVAAQRLLKQERSSSALIFYWGIGKSFPALQLHNIFFSNSYREEFEAIFKHRQLHSDPTVYVNITAKCEPGLHAPAGKENWFVMVNAPAGDYAGHEQVKQQCRANVIQKLNRLLQTDIEPLIEEEQVMDPTGIEAQTASYMGSLYGTSSNSPMAAFLRHPNFSRSIKGLYFAGGSVHPGGGIPLCLRSAAIVAGKILDT